MELLAISSRRTSGFFFFLKFQIIGLPVGSIQFEQICNQTGNVAKGALLGLFNYSFGSVPSTNNKIFHDFGLLGSQFPPGFRFHPTDEELLIHYLRKKVTSSMTAATSIIADIDLYKFNPRDLPDKAFFGEGEWFFFTPRDRKYPNGARPNRAAASGYWKATGTDKPIIAAGGSQCLGVKKALVFYEGRPPKGIKTDWVMHEYRLLDASPSSWPQKPRDSMRLDDWVLCRVRQKGCAIAGTEEKSENSSLINPSADQSRGKQSDVKVKSNSFYDWGDYQLLSYLLNSEEDGGDSGYRNSYLCSANGYSDLNNTLSSGFAADESQPPQQVASALNSIKRTLSFGVLDEIMLLPPSKRLHFSSDINDQALPTGPVFAE